MQRRPGQLQQQQELRRQQQKEASRGSTCITKELTISHIPRSCHSNAKGIYDGEGTFSDFEDINPQKILMVRCKGDGASEFYKAMERISMKRLAKPHGFFTVNDGSSYITFSNCKLTLGDYVQHQHDKICRIRNTKIYGFSTELIWILRDVVCGICALHEKKFSCPGLNVNSVMIFPREGNRRANAKLSNFLDEKSDKDGADWVQLGDLLEIVLKQVFGRFPLIEEEIDDLILKLQSKRLSGDDVLYHPALTTPNQTVDYIKNLQARTVKNIWFVDSNYCHNTLFNGLDWTNEIDKQIFKGMTSKISRANFVSDFIFSIESMFEHKEVYAQYMHQDEEYAEGVIRIIKENFPFTFLRLKELFN